MRQIQWWLVITILLLAGGACSSVTKTTAADDLATSDPTASGPTALPEPTATAGPPSIPPADSGASPTPDGPTERPAPPLVLPPQPPGTDEAYQAMITELDRFVTDEQRAAGVPWPDLRNPDPIAAYQSCAVFQNWMSENNPTPSLVEAYTAPGSPERGWDLDLFDFQNAFDLIATPGVPPYSMRVAGLVHPAATDITDALLERVPEGSAAVVYWDSAGRSDMVDPNGQIFRTDEGWVDLGPWVAIMAPTDVGWRVWWDELTTIPPPELGDNRGMPDDEPPRRQV